MFYHFFNKGSCVNIDENWPEIITPPIIFLGEILTPPVIIYWKDITLSFENYVLLKI